MILSGDPLRDYDRYDAEQYRQLKKLPCCCKCEKPIQEEYLYDVFDALYCEDCMNNTYRQPVEDYIGRI